MKRLFDAFLELPSWQGCALIAAVVFGVGYASWRMFWLGYRIGRRDGEAGAIRFHEKQREREAIRL